MEPCILDLWVLQIKVQFRKLLFGFNENSSHKIVHNKVFFWLLANDTWYSGKS